MRCTGFPVHGCADGYSRKFIYLKGTQYLIVVLSCSAVSFVHALVLVMIAHSTHAAMPSNNDPRFVVPEYFKVVAKYNAVPVVVVADYGCELLVCCVVF